MSNKNSRLPYQRRSKVDKGTAPIQPCYCSEWRHLTDLQRRHFTTTVNDLEKLGFNQLKYLSQALVVSKSRARVEWLEENLESIEVADIGAYSKAHGLLLREQSHCLKLEQALGLTFRSATAVCRENIAMDKMRTKTAAEKAGIREKRTRDKNVSPLRQLLQNPNTGRRPLGSSDKK